jgi:hypothetical protein
MGHFNNVIETLLKDLQQKGLQKVAKDMKIPVNEGSISFTMLGDSFRLTENGVTKNKEEPDEVESLVILNAALSPGDSGVLPEWRSYEKFVGTRGHVLSFKKTIEGSLANIAGVIVEKKELIIQKYNAQILDNMGGTDLSFIFTPFPNLRLFCQIYLADEEFPAEAKIFFSANDDKFMPALCFEKLAMLWVKQLQKFLNYNKKD